MAKPKTEFTCTACGATAPKWAGQCTDCGAWNTMEESVVPAKTPAGSRFAGYTGGASASRITALGEVSIAATERQATGIGELDRVLGGGLVPGAVVLLGGDPGIGKSTLLLQVLAQLGGDTSGLYVTGEESLEQVALRARRLGLSAEGLDALTETCVERIVASAETNRPDVLVIDSIQTLYTEQLQSAPGSVSQVRESAAQLVRFAKHTGASLFLVGHVTKEGAIAGPRVLEHMVDAVLYFEGDSGSRFRVVRAMKNRFGAVNELGVFAMTEQGLKGVTNPSAIFLSRHPGPIPGSAVLVTREGTRPLLVEVQALVDQSHLSNPRRVTVGLDHNRLAMLLAVLHRHGGIALYDHDVFVNAVGGMRVSETASDLAVALSVLSSFRDRPLPEGQVVFGEIGLAGEIRPVPNGEERLREAAKHGFTRAVVPKANMPKRQPKGLEVIGVARLAEALDVI
jgi:DNA repair protein RadA/Sms